MAQTAIDLVQAAKTNITEITVSQANALFAADSIPLDVRELLEYQTSHIPGARLIPRGVLEFQIADHPDFQDKTTAIVVYCKSGSRSALATETLQQLGYTNVQSMIGGFEGWSETSEISSLT